MSIDWSALGQVLGVSLAATVGLVTVFTLGIVATSRRPQQGTAGGGQPGAVAGGVPTGARPSVWARSGGYLCYAVCAAAVAYGIYLIVMG